MWSMTIGGRFWTRDLRAGGVRLRRPDISVPFRGRTYTTAYVHLQLIWRKAGSPV